MKLQIQHINKYALPFLFGAIVFIFFSQFYAGHLHYQEQFQLFLFDSFYCQERIATPGGFAEYIAEFFTQFYYHSWLGAIIIAGLLIALQQLVWHTAKGFKNNPSYYPLTFIPSIAMWAFLCDENSMLAFLISVIISLMATASFRWINSLIHRLIYGVILLPILYWCIGGAFYITIALAILQALYTTNKASQKGLFAVVVVGIGIACPLLVKDYMQFPLTNLFLGIGYYRFPNVLPYTTLITMALTIIVPLLFAWLPKTKEWSSIALIIVMAGVTIPTINFSANMSKEEIMTYDYLARKQYWQQIIEKAEQKEPSSPLSVVALNLALGKTGQLGERMFEFYQKGTQGLFIEFERDYTSPLITGEVYYHLGMINTAQRHAFEAMEAIPNFRKSVRGFKRLAETNLINGEYEAASKYINALAKTTYYRKWANHAKTFLYDENKISMNPEWGYLRGMRYPKDFLFSPTEKDMMLGFLITHNTRNKMAFEYLLAYTLLNKDMEAFMRYYPLGRSMGYKQIPRSYQEALSMVWSQQNSSFDGIPWSISPAVKSSMTDFARIYSQGQQSSQAILGEKYGDTYWNYLIFNN